jgi:hypothetical protein
VEMASGLMASNRNGTDRNQRLEHVEMPKQAPTSTRKENGTCDSYLRFLPVITVRRL